METDRHGYELFQLEIIFHPYLFDRWIELELPLPGETEAPLKIQYDFTTSNIICRKNVVRKIEILPINDFNSKIWQMLV